MPTHEELVKAAGTITPDKAHSDANPKVFFDIKIGDPHAGRVTFEVMTLRHTSLDCYQRPMVNSSPVWSPLYCSLPCFKVLQFVASLR